MEPNEWLLAPLVTALLAALAAVLRKWWQYRDREHRVTRDMAQAAAEVKFLTEWQAAADKADPHAPDTIDIVTNGLHEALALAGQATALARTAREPLTWRKAARWLFLVPMRSWWGWVTWVTIYLPAAFWMLGWSIVGSQETAATPGDIALAVLMITFLGVLPFLAARALVLFCDRNPPFSRRQ